MYGSGNLPRHVMMTFDRERACGGYLSLTITFPDKQNTRTVITSSLELNLLI